MFSKQQLNQLYQYAYSLTANRDEAYDLLQTCLEKYLRNQGSVKNARAWMIKVMRNQFYDQVRRQQPELIDLNDSRLASISDELGSLEDMVIERDMIEQLWNELDYNEREILYFWAVLGCTSTQIAKSLDAPRGTIVSRIHRVKNKLKRITSIKFKRAL